MEKIILVALLLIITGCNSNTGDVDQSEWMSDFYKMSPTEQKIEFRRYELEKQYQLYIFGNQIRHPAATYLADTFAEGGSKVVPFLKDKLESTDSDLTVRDIVMIFSYMSMRNYYDVKNDKVLTALLYHKVNEMDSIWKDTTLAILSNSYIVE